MIHWSPDPIIFTLGPLTIRWYGLMFLIGFTIGYLIVKDMCRREGRNFEHLEGLLIYVVLGTTIGARLGHCLFYEPGYYLAHPLAILKIWEGGLASHGGVIGVVFAVWLFARKHAEFPMMWILDRLSVPVPLIAAFIRIGNVMNSEILGRPADVPWSFVFERIDKVPRHPAQLYESLSYFVLFILLYAYYRRNNRPPRGLIFGSMLVWIFVWRMIWETFKENQEAFEQGMALNMGQILSIPMILIGLFFIWRALKNRGLPVDEGVPAGAGAGAPLSVVRPKRKRRK